jgi:DNA-binding response OmpR family regulator
MPILNVDDNGPSRFLRSRILERAGFDVREADSAQQALAYGRSSVPPSLILLDVSLPDGDGFSVCEQIKAVHPQVPVVMITTVYQSAQARRDGFEAGADEYLLDPIEPERLVDAVSRFLDPGRVSTSLAPPTIITDKHGLILSANAAAARLLNLTTRGIRERSMLTFIDGDRERAAGYMRRAAGGAVAQGDVILRPRDRKPFTARLDISAAPFERGECLEWVIEPQRDRVP